MRKRESLPSTGKIFDYWKDKHDITGFCFVDWDPKEAQLLEKNARKIKIFE